MLYLSMWITIEHIPDKIERCVNNFGGRKGPIAVDISPRFPVKEYSTGAAQEDVLGAAKQQSQRRSTCKKMRW